MAREKKVVGGCLKETEGEEGRDKLRKAARRSTYPMSRGCPNGVTHILRGMYREG